MNSHIYEVFKIRSTFLKKIKNVCNQYNSHNYYYIENLKDFIDFYLNNNMCNTTNNDLLNRLKDNINRWNINIIDINNIIMTDLSNFIYNYDGTDNEMNDLMIKLIELI